MIIVTGTGRCGTGFMSKLLTSAGIDIGHERVFNPTSIDHSDIRDGDSSWLAVPFLKDYPKDTLIHVVRQPIKVINSFLSIPFFTKKTFHFTFMTRHLPSNDDYDNIIDKAFHYIIEWNNKIFEYKDSERYTLHRVEDNNIPLIEQLGGNTKNLFDNTKYNTTKKTYSLTENDVPDKWKDKYFELKRKMGY